MGIGEAEWAVNDACAIDLDSGGGAGVGRGRDRRRGSLGRCDHFSVWYIFAEELEANEEIALLLPGGQGIHSAFCGAFEQSAVGTEYAVVAGTEEVASGGAPAHRAAEVGTDGGKDADFAVGGALDVNRLRGCGYAPAVELSIGDLQLYRRAAGWWKGVHESNFRPL